MNYLDEKVLTGIDIKLYNTNDLTSNDTYNEKEILNVFLKYSKHDQEVMELIAIQSSIIGFGNKNLGMITINNKPVKVEDELARLKIKHGKGMNEKFDENELTLRRLQRLLRYQVKKFIEKNQRASFLYIKYSEMNPVYMNICFPLAEHLIDNLDQAKYLYKTYKNIDHRLGSRFCEKIHRVLLARKIIIQVSDLN
jgi:hypothetical protein